MPDVALLPLQSPDAVHAVAFVEDHVSVELPPEFTVVGFALKLTVGAGGGGGAAVTVTDADFCVVPPAPVQLRL